MKGKKIVALLITVSMICSGFVSYAAETPVEESEMTDIAQDISDQDEDIQQEEEVIFNIGINAMTVETGEKAWFYVEYNGSDELEISVDNSECVEIKSTDSENVADEYKAEAPENAKWYEVIGLSEGETDIHIYAGEMIKGIHISVIAVPEEEEGGNSPVTPVPGDDESGSDNTEDVPDSSPSDEETDDIVSGDDNMSDDNDDTECNDQTEVPGSDSVSENVSDESEIQQDKENGLNTLTVSAGWITDENGTRYYTGTEGEYYTGIADIDGKRYYFDLNTGYLVKAQWIETDDGKRYFSNEEGVLYQNQFIKFSTTYYYMGSDGSVQSGIFTASDGNIYYADPATGITQRTSGWIDFAEKRYYAGESGVLYCGQFVEVDGISYYMGSDGSMKKGTFNVGSVWYHANSQTGAIEMNAGWIEDEGKRYFVQNGGALYINQFIKFSNDYYYMGVDGSVQKGLIDVSGDLYYADSATGLVKMDSGWVTYNNKRYFAAGGGILYKNQFINFGDTYYYMGSDGSVQLGAFNVDGTIYYADPVSGIIQSTGGWIENDGKKYFAKPDGTLYKNQLIKFGDTYYYMGSDGSVQKGVAVSDGVVYYADPVTGILQNYTGWLDYNEKRYFGKGDGTLYSSQFIKFGTIYYYMGADGSVQKGIVEVNGVVYYADPATGIITSITGWFDVDGKRYFGKGDGTLYSNQFIKFGTIYYYMGADGSVQKGIVEVSGLLYYADPSTGIVQMTAGWIDYNGNRYFANEAGILYRNQFISFGPDQYYMGVDGSVQKGGQYINGHWYYFDEETGVLLRQEGWFVSGSHKYYQKADGTLAKGYTDIDGVRYYFDSNGALASKMGIDVSYYQGNIDWNKVKAAGVEFVFIRAGYRGYSNGRLVEDTCFEKNIRGALAAGIEVGIYFFSQAINTEEAREEAEFTYNLIKNYNVTFPVAFDAEYANGSHTGRADHISPATRTAVVKTFLSTIQNYGYTPMLYSGQYFMKDELQMSALSDYLIWMPQYNDTLTYTGPYKCWQYSDSGKIDGISGNVDMNVWIN